jgi:HD superfamily phosphodiesterase
MPKINQVALAMTALYAGDAHRINHFLKVWAFASIIGESEGLAPEELEILEVAALTHDIGIQSSLEKYQSSAPRYQQIEGPPQARSLLAELGYGPALIQRVCWLIAHHHEDQSIVDIDHQILVEADFLVNAFEYAMPARTIVDTGKSVFRTAAGRLLLSQVYRQVLSGSQDVK